MNKQLEAIIAYLHEKRGFDFSGYRFTLIERRLNQRLLATKSTTYSEYLRYLENDQNELNNLVDVLTINVSRFFRDSFIFECIADKLLPLMISNKTQYDNSLRVWSAGCSTGEEPYSIAILINEMRKGESPELNLHIFATDIDTKAMAKAQEAVYPFQSFKDVKYGLLQKYFTPEGEFYRLHPEIKAMVNFSFYDMLDNKSYVPPESVYGDFDLVLCRNLLIYFTIDHQDIIFNKLHRSLTQNGYLILGKAECPTKNYQKYFKRINEWCNIYQKR